MLPKELFDLNKRTLYSETFKTVKVEFVEIVIFFIKKQKLVLINRTTARYPITKTSTSKMQNVLLIC